MHQRADEKEPARQHLDTKHEQRMQMSRDAHSETEIGSLGVEILCPL